MPAPSVCRSSPAPRITINRMAVVRQNLGRTFHIRGLRSTLGCSSFFRSPASLFVRFCSALSSPSPGRPFFRALYPRLTAIIISMTAALIRCPSLHLQIGLIGLSSGQPSVQFIHTRFRSIARAMLHPLHACLKVTRRNASDSCGERESVKKGDQEYG